MGSRVRLSYRWRLFVFVMAIIVSMVVSFLLFQYSREKTYKADRLDAQLQMFNMQLCHAIAAGESPEEFFERHSNCMEGLRLTVLDMDGRVVYDDSATGGRSDSLSDHMSRKEIVEAIDNGTGHTIARLSENTKQRYLYSAMRSGDMIVRSALPYNVSLIEVLRADSDFFHVIVVVSLIVLAVSYWATRKLGDNISNLQRAAESMDRGEHVELPLFADDELGEISEHIVAMYEKLRRANGDIEREHALALHEQLEQLRIKRQLTNNINHELKTPVAAIQGYLETILSAPDMSAAQREEFLDKCYRQSCRLTQLLHDVSTLTRLDDGSTVIERETVDLRAIIDEIAAEVALLPNDRRMRVKCDLPQHMPVYGNSSLLISIMRNLTDNALAYSAGRDIFISSTLCEGMYEIVFADNGIGVDPAHIDHILERFYRVDKGRSRKSGGTGLGLSIVKNAVLFHGGRIEVSNRRSGGLEVRFTLPRAMDDHTHEAILSES